MRINNRFLISLVVTGLVCSGLTYFYCKQNFKAKAENNNSLSNLEAAPLENEFRENRTNGYEYVKPLLSNDKKEESTSLANLKTAINNLIEENKKSGVLISASVYLHVFKNEDWICLNDTETYLPGSLIKVAGLLTYLRMEEAHPGLLDKKLLFDSPTEKIPDQTFKSKQLISGKSYTVRELLKYMIAYSDNDATYLLNKSVDIKMFEKLFTDLNIPAPELKAYDFKMKVKDYSLFLKVIYNSSYLSLDHSEFAAELLSQCDFTEGMVKGLPKGTKIAHKFGEMGDATTRQLHESGIIYVNNTPYLLTIMLKGYDITKLPPVLSGITKLTYEEISKTAAL